MSGNQRSVQADSPGERRRFGELESEVLTVLWASPGPMSPVAVQEALGGGLAYTTVMTILVRLLAKGVIERTKVGRAYEYRPVVTEAEVVAEHVRRLLDHGQNRHSVLQGLVDGLHAEEESTLRQLLAETEQRRRRP
ncbi:MAG: transcriptional repressor, CopY family [Ilumatobacteraceae bacterium]|nr:transcriptional repressor, CopY family [Ilumatobacteraceae bacterium]